MYFITPVICKTCRQKHSLIVKPVSPRTTVRCVLDLTCNWPMSRVYCVSGLCEWCLLCVSVLTFDRPRSGVALYFRSSMAWPMKCVLLCISDLAWPGLWVVMLCISGLAWPGLWVVLLCISGLACYRPMSGVCCPPMTCYDEAYVHQQQAYWSKCLSDPTCPIPP
jgi:hypothetical protein